MMLATTEVRWWFRGDPPEAVRDWFRQSDMMAEQAERVDEYLLLPGARAVGVKLREGRFEIKAQTAMPAPVVYPGGVEGCRDGWVKWSRSLGNSRTARRFLSREGERWVRVAKQRSLRSFSVDQAAPGEDPREIATEGPVPERGCGVEITRVRVLDEGGGDEASLLRVPAGDWWTLALESFGARDDDRVDALDRTAGLLFAAAPPARLRPDNSFSYVAWLDGAAAAAD